MNGGGSVKIEVFLPGEKKPVSMEEYATFVALGNHDGKGTLNPDLFVYDEAGGKDRWEVKKGPNPLA